MKRSFPRPAASLLLLAAMLGACDGTSEPPRPVLGGAEAYAGADPQSAQAGNTVAVAPVVRVLDTRGRPLVGVTVQFVVTRGGGTVVKASPRSDSLGLASAEGWTLGTAGLNQVEARIGALPPILFTATATAPPPVEPPVQPVAPPLPPVLPSFHVDVRIVGSLTERQRQAVTAAVARWESVITTDPRDVMVSLAAGECFAAQPTLNLLVDDLVLFVEFVPIDGVGKVLGEAGPCYIRSESALPIIGHLKLDSADLGRMEQYGTLDDVVLHEIGHILGIGTLWDHLDLLNGAGTTDPRFTGAKALEAYRAMGGLAADVAVENEGGAGTRDSHWRETEFRSELMTGYVGTVPNPLSALTIASLQDLGYGANPLTASQYTLGSTFGASVGAAVDLRGRERLRGPKLKVDARGKRERVAG